MHRRIGHSRSEARGNAVLRHRQAKPHDQVLWGRLRGRFRRSAADRPGREAQTGRRDLVWGRMWRGKAGRLHARGQLHRVDRVDRVALKHVWSFDSSFKTQYLRAILAITKKFK
uniref:(northern house mosquito) hypothetical protein n=1 Tax=Culex pipiens TaxID=7175 RepID=A0A8D8MWR5_CULPI